MVCKHCGEEITSNSKYCNFCGKKIPVIKEKPIKKEKTIETEIATEVLEKKKIKILPIFISFAVVIILITSLYYLFPIFKYESATKKFNQGSYLEAQAIFLELEDFKDSKQKVIECKYNIASEYLENKKYLASLNIFEEIKDYSDSYQKIIEATYLLGKEFYNSKDFSNAINYLNRITDYKDAKKIIIDSKYEFSIQKYNDGSFISAKMYLEEISDYKDASLFLSNINFIESIQGTYAQKSHVELGVTNWFSLVIDDLKIYYIFDPNTNKCQTFDYSIHTIDASSKTFYAVDDYYEVRGNNIYKHNVSLDGKISSKIEETYIKQSSSTYVSSKGYSPKIGMSASEVRNSMWGSPNKINKTTTSYGTKEQWVYGSGKYIYLENGIVTAIQE